MDFKDKLQQLSERINKQKDSIATEEATKNAFILPLISALGYDVFDPFEVVPEVDCDLVKKKGEKIDYAIKREGETILLIECKHCAQNLNLHDTQLKKYFVASNARFGVLTNGIEYRFYTDLEKPNIMDDKPFLQVNMMELSDHDVEQMKKFHKSYYDVDNILSTAQELKYTTELRNIITSEFNSPTPEFVRYFTKQVYDSPVSQKVIDQFTPLVKKAISGIINDTISDRLGLALKSGKGDGASEQEQPSENKPDVSAENELPEGVVFMDKETGIVTTQEEIDSYLIVKAILCTYVDVNRIVYRDALKYFAILLDDNNRKPICRMYFNAKSVKYIGIPNEDNKDTRYVIESLNDIYKFSDALRNRVDYLENNRK